MQSSLPCRSNEVIGLCLFILFILQAFDNKSPNAFNV